MKKIIFWQKQFLSVLFICLLVACGGSPSSTTPSSTSTPSLSLAILDSDGRIVSSTAMGKNYTLRATVTQSSGAASNVIVTFGAATLAKLTPTSATALTNSSGIATITFTPIAAGAESITATANVTLVTTSSDGKTSTSSSTTVRGSTNYSSSANATDVITLGSISLGSTSLSSGGSSSVSVNVYRNGDLATTSAITVGLSATCGQIKPNVTSTDGNGNVSATYSSIKEDGTLCQGSVTLTATAASVTTSATLSVAVPTTGTISFVSVEPVQIFLPSSGASSQATLTFKVLSSGLVQANLPVTLTLTGNPGGVTFGTYGNTSPITVNSDASGLVKVDVYAGGTPGAVTVKAEWASNSTIFATSNNLKVASGAAQQKRMDLVATVYNIEGWEITGTPTTLSVYVADANGNAIPAGTVVQFTSEGGQIGNSCTLSVDSAGHSHCSVDFISQNPRPSNGRVAVLAYLEGIKTYTDNNNNNQFDSGIDAVTDQGDAYRDDNENGAFDLGEFVITRGGGTACVGTGGVYPSKANTCTGANSIATTVRSQANILLSSNIPKLTAITTSAFTNPAAKSFDFLLNGNGTPLLPMPYNTSVSAMITSPSIGCTSSAPSVTSIPKTSPGTDPGANLGTIIRVTLTGTVATATAPAITCSGATLQITTTAPSGITYQRSITIP